MNKRASFRSPFLPWLLVLPQLAIVLVFFFWPAAQALLQSVQQTDAFGTSSAFVGLDNFSALVGDEVYRKSFATTAVFSLWVAGLGIGLSFVLAFFADRALRTQPLYTSLLLLPYAVAPAVAGASWLFLFSPTVGVATWVLARAGLEFKFLLDSDHGMALVVMASVWKQVSYNFLFFLAGLRSIPKSLIEAATIDGAGVWHRLRTIQLPLLSPTTFFLLVMNTIYAFFETFGVIDATTRGGPGTDTAILVYKVYSDGFKAMDLGSSAAQSVILMAIVIGLTALQFRYVERKVVY